MDLLGEDGPVSPQARFASRVLLKGCSRFRAHGLPMVSIVVPFWGYLIRILNIKLVNPKKGNYNGDYR